MFVSQKTDRGLGCFSCGRSKVRCSLVANAIRAPARAAGDSKGTLLGLHEDLCAWSLKWQAEFEQRARIDQEYIKVFIKISSVLLPLHLLLLHLLPLHSLHLLFSLALFLHLLHCLFSLLVLRS
jgi:hypothetical protein